MIKTKVYAGRIKDRRVLDYCSSGGAFTALSDVFLENGNAILCAKYNYETHQAEYCVVKDKTTRDLCRGSIYVQSFAMNSWREAEEWLENNPEKSMIFFGLGCQGAAFKSFCRMKGLLERVTIVDLICHGLPSPMLWKDYVTNLEKKGKLSDINLRDKRIGWKKSIGIAKLNGKEISLSKWRMAYSSKTMMRPCCASCPYTSIKRKTDITIGDYWGIEKSMPDFYDNKGTSIFIIHTEKGQQLFDLIKNTIDYRESNTSDCWQPNLEKPTQHSLKRAMFWDDYKKRGITYVMNKYGSVSLLKKIKKSIRSIIIKKI